MNERIKAIIDRTAPEDRKALWHALGEVLRDGNKPDSTTHTGGVHTNDDPGSSDPPPPPKPK